MQVLGVVSGYIIGSLAVALHQYQLGLVALGILELLTMLSVVVRVREGPPPMRERMAKRRFWLSSRLL